MVRKHYFIKKGLQTRFIGTVLLIVLLVIVVIACNLYFFGMFLVQDSEFSATYVEALNNLKNDLTNKLFGRLVLLGIVNIIIVILISLFFSHQIAGPVYKLEKTLQKIIEEGDLNIKFSFRQSDKLDELAVLLNDMKDKFVSVLKVAKDVNTNVIKLIDEKQAAAISEVKEHHLKLSNALNEFNLDNLKDEEPAKNSDSNEEKKA